MRHVRCLVRLSVEPPVECRVVRAEGIEKSVGQVDLSEDRSPNGKNGVVDQLRVLGCRFLQEAVDCEYARADTEALSLPGDATIFRDQNVDTFRVQLVQDQAVIS